MIGIKGMQQPHPNISKFFFFFLHITTNSVEHWTRAYSEEQSHCSYTLVRETLSYRVTGWGSPSLVERVLSMCKALVSALLFWTQIVLPISVGWISFPRLALNLQFS